MRKLDTTLVKLEFLAQLLYIEQKDVLLMNDCIPYASVKITFPKSIIERDDGQINNSCVATHSEEARVA